MSFDPEISEWSNPIRVMSDDPAKQEELPGELKHLSTQGEEINRDSHSSGERNGTSLNPLNVIGYSRFSEGVVRAPSTACKLWRCKYLLTKRAWKGRP